MEDNEIIKINYDADDNSQNSEPAQEILVDKNNENVAEEYQENAKKESRWGKIKEIKEQRNYLAEENELLKQELAERERLLKQSYDSSVYQQGQSITNSFANAKQNYIAALYSGDPEIMANAAAEMAAATSDLTIVNEKIAELQRQNNYQPDYYEEDNQVIFDPVEEWLEENDELDNNSPNFNPNLVNQLIPYIKKVDDKLRQSKQTDLIGTPQYFNLLDKYIERVKSNRSNDNGYIGSVNSRYSGSGSNRTEQIRLTQDQKEAAAAFDMTEKEYAGYLKKYAEEARNGR